MKNQSINDLPFHYIKRPLITEKSTNKTSSNNCYSFIVDKKVDKLSIKSLIECIYQVKVDKVRTCHLPPKKFGYKKLNRFKPNYKKAIVKLMNDDKIDLYQS